MTLRLDIPAAPNLPIGGMGYRQDYQEGLNNVHRLFYNRLVASMQNLTGPQGGRFLNFPYLAAQKTADKTFTANTATLITFNQTDYSNAITNNTSDGFHVEFEGIYNYQFSIQWANTDSQEHDGWCWLRKNGTDVAGTASQFTVPKKHGTVDGHSIGAANFFIQLAANDYVEMWAAVNDATVSMDYSAAQTVPFAMPAIPSVVATLSFVSSIPA